MILDAQHLRVRLSQQRSRRARLSFKVVDSGQVVALFGPNGASKTTSMRAASGILKTQGAKVVKGKGSSSETTALLGTGTSLRSSR